MTITQETLVRYVKYRLTIISEEYDTDDSSSIGIGRMMELMMLLNKVENGDLDLDHRL